MDLTENELLHETFFHRALKNSTEFSCSTLQKFFSVN